MHLQYRGERRKKERNEKRKFDGINSVFIATAIFIFILIFLVLIYFNWL